MSFHQHSRKRQALSPLLSGSRIAPHISKRCVTIDILPDDVLLLIFHFDGLEDRSYRRSWYRLVHVCRRWRSIVFASPNSLGLKLVCSPTTRVELPGIWPQLPIMIKAYGHIPKDYDFNAAIVHVNRVSEMTLYDLTSSQLQRLASAMQEQFPALTNLRLGISRYSGAAPALPDGFLGGSAPRLQYLELDSIPFPALPKLLLSATDLVELSLWNIPQSGYISPKVIVATLVGLANLRYLNIGFESPLSHLDRESRRPLPPTRTALPALTYFFFHGVSEYLEDLVARIDAPLLNSISITFFHQLIFDIPQFALFMTRTPMSFQTFDDEAYVGFSSGQVGFYSKGHQYTIELTIPCRKLDSQLSSLAQVLTFFPPIHMVKYLSFGGDSIYLSEDIESTQWLVLFRQLTAVKQLFTDENLAQSIALGLQELVGDSERVTDVLPALERLSLKGLQSSGPAQEAIGKFVAARELSGHPVVVDWE